MMFFFMAHWKLIHLSIRMPRTVLQAPTYSYHMSCVELSLKEVPLHPPRQQRTTYKTFGLLSNGCTMLVRPNKSETAVHGCHCPGDLAVRMRKVMAIPRSWCSSVLSAVYSFLHTQTDRQTFPRKSRTQKHYKNYKMHTNVYCKYKIGW